MKATLALLTSGCLLFAAKAADENEFAAALEKAEAFLKTPEKTALAQAASPTLTKISYPPSRAWTRLRYSEMAKSDGGSALRESELDILASSGELDFHGTTERIASSSNLKPLPAVDKILLLKGKADKFIAAGVDASKCAFLEAAWGRRIGEKLKERIPVPLEAKDLVFESVEQDPEEETLVFGYRIIPTLFSLNRRSASFLKVRVKTSASSCVANGIEAVDCEGANPLPPGFAPPALSEADRLDIYEAAFRRMSDEWSGALKSKAYRLEDNSREGALPEELFERFKGEPRLIRVPAVETAKIPSDSRKPRRGVYLSIEGLAAFDGELAMLSCKISYPLGASGCKYALEKKDGKWMVVESFGGWM